MPRKRDDGEKRTNQLKFDEMSAKDLFAEMRKYKSRDEVVPGTDGKTAREVFMPLMIKYSRIYDDIELRETAAQKASKEMRNIIKDMDTYELHARLARKRAMLIQSIPNAMAYVCATLSISMPNTSKDSTARFNFAYIYIKLGEKPEIAYISLGDSLMSCDGEWRNHMTNRATYSHLISTYAQQIDKLVEIIDGKIDPEVAFYYDTDLHPTVLKDLHALVEQERLKERLSALTWFLACYEQKYGASQFVSENMTYFVTQCDASPIGSDIRVDDARDISMIIGSCLDSLSYKIIRNMTIESHAVRIGQKLIQLAVDESAHIMNRDHQVWNEVGVTMDSLDLLLNMITPSFAIHSFWLLLFETSKYMFNLKESRARIELSQSMRQTPADKRVGRIYANEALVFANEYCGPTFRFSIMDARLREKTLKFGEKYVFELIYGLYCMHSRMGQFHGDFHCDNATIMTLDSRLSADSANSDAKSAHMAYIIGANHYLFDHSGSYGCIIDFSRTIAIDDPRWIERVIEKYEFFFKQPSAQTRSAFEKNVYGALDDKKVHDRLARIATAFDAYEFAMTSLIRCASVLESTKLGALLSSIKETAQDILMSVTEEIKPSAMSVEDSTSSVLEWADLIILKKHWQTSPASALVAHSKSLRGVYTYDNPMKYSGRAYESLPKSLSADPMMRDAKDRPVDTFRIGLMIKARYKMIEANMKELGD